MSNPRKIIQIILGPYNRLYALCDDGTVWFQTTEANVKQWYLEDSIAQIAIKHKADNIKTERPKPIT